MITRTIQNSDAMKSALILLLFLWGCTEKKTDKMFDTAKQDVRVIEKEIADYHTALKRAYNHRGVNTDSLVDAYFDPDVYYVTYWGNSEPIDTTKKRLRDALPRVSDYDNQYESLKVRVYGDGAYAFFILRQNYKVDGNPLEEYLPTTYVLERRGDRWMIVHAQRTSDYQTMEQLVALSRSIQSKTAGESQR
ncbi:MAG TPA: nuclear transport factor 2 family protein [Bacteroidota bacterium]